MPKTYNLMKYPKICNRCSDKFVGSMQQMIRNWGFNNVHKMHRASETKLLSLTYTTITRYTFSIIIWYSETFSFVSCQRAKKMLGRVINIQGKQQTDKQATNARAGKLPIKKRGKGGRLTSVSTSRLHNC